MKQILHVMNDILTLRLAIVITFANGATKEIFSEFCTPAYEYYNVRATGDQWNGD